MSAEVYKAIYEKVLLKESKKPDGLCCVCLQAIDEDLSGIHDESVVFNLSTTVVVETLAYILEALIGKSFSDVSSMFNAICHLCKEATISSYSFILSSRENAQVLNTAIEDLEKCFIDIPESTLNNCKSLFVELNLNDVERSSIIQSYYDTVSSKSTAEALERMRLIVEDQNDMTDMLAFCDDHPNEIKPKFDHNVEFGTDESYDEEFRTDESNTEAIPGVQIESAEPQNLQQVKILTELAVEIQNTKCLKHFYCPDCKAGFNCLERYKNHRNAKKKCTSRARGNYSCEQCDFTAVYKSLINRHMRFQHDNPSIICEWCGKSCNSQSELKIHVLKHSHSKNFECQQCGGKFKTASTLKNHMTLHSGERNYPCNFCDKSFRNASSRNEHTRRHHIQNPVQCDICKKEFKVKEDLLRHMRTHFSDEKRKYACSECAHQAYNKRELDQHVNFKHRGERPFKCEICDKNFGTQRILNIHKSTHIGKTYDCKECDESFKSLFGLKSHMFKHTGLKPYPCKYCDQKFKDSNRRLDHIRRHHIFEPHECNICKKVYRTQADLQRHKKGHSGDKGFPCSECAHRAYTKPELAQHVNYKHRGQRPFKCEICDKTFGTTKILNIHKSIHRGKTYDCKECDESFKSLFGLKSHMFKHTGVKPYPCQYCDKTFKDTNRRLDHTRRHHIFQPYECDICKKVYRTQGDLCRHKKSHLVWWKEKDEASESSDENLSDSDQNQYEGEFKKYLKRT